MSSEFNLFGKQCNPRLPVFFTLVRELCFVFRREKFLCPNGGNRTGISLARGGPLSML
jgi:hypothetical protein